VIDKDRWADEQLSAFHAWVRQDGNRGLALSNPKFEYGLLLHFEDDNSITSSARCDKRLKRHLPDCDKGIDAQEFGREQIRTVLARAKKRDSPPCPDWPRNCGATTVYKLAERILPAQSCETA
jgi:hypothetical protein